MRYENITKICLIMISFLKTINMKRILVSCVIYALFACNILAQTQMNRSYLYNRGYKANIQASVLFANNSELSSISSSHGYSFGNGLYLGGGTGIVYSPLRKLNVRNQIIIPFFGVIKYSFLKNAIVSPFVDLVAGGAYNYSSYGTGYLLKPSVGLDVWRFSASVGVGRYAINYATVDGRQNGEPAIIGDKQTSTGLFISIAYNFR